MIRCREDHRQGRGRLPPSIQSKPSSSSAVGHTCPILCVLLLKSGAPTISLATFLQGKTGTPTASGLRFQSWHTGQIPLIFHVSSGKSVSLLPRRDEAKEMGKVSDVCAKETALGLWETFARPWEKYFDLANPISCLTFP